MLKNQRHSAILLLLSPGAAQGEALFTNWFCAKEEVSRALELAETRVSSNIENRCCRLSCIDAQAGMRRPSLFVK